MQLKRHTKITGLVLVISLGMAALLFALPFYLFSDQMLAARLTSGIQQGIAHTGLKLEIGSVRWVDWNHLTAERVVFKDSYTGERPLRVEQVNFRFNVFSLLKNRRYPEACLRQVELVKPVVKVYRINNDDWNWEYYFRNPRRELRFNTIFLVKEGRIELQEQRFGRQLAQQINGRFNLKDYPLVKWDLKGGMAGQVDLNWSSRGQTKIRHHYGNGELLLKQAPLTELAAFLPYPEHYRFRSGLVDLKLNFSWDQKGFQVQQGRLKLTEAWFTLEQNEKPLQLRLVEAEFTAKQIRVDRAQLACDQSLIRLTGSYNRQTGVIYGNINADPVDLTTLARFLPDLRRYTPAGTGRAYLTVGGTWRKPIINGTLLVEAGQVSLTGRETITGINGRITIDHNQLQIPKLVGVWRQLHLGLSGQISDPWQPELNLQLTGTGLNLDQFGQSYPKMTRLNRLHTGNASFTATITGQLQRPVINGELAIDQMAYNDHSITNFRTKFYWDHPGRSLVLQEYYGDLWGGQLGGTGTVQFQPEQISWLIKGELSNFNLPAVSIEQLRDLKGRGWATLILQGAWRQGEVFNPGSVQGRMESRALSYHDLYLESLAADFNWQNQSLTISALTATAATGVINGRMTWENQQLLLELTSAGISLRPFLPDAQKYPLDGVFAGSFVLWGPLDQLEGRLEGIFTTATWGTKPVGTIKGALVYQNHRIGVTDLQIDSETGIFTVNGGIDWERWGTEPILDLELRSNDLNFNGLQRWLPWKQNLPIDGSGQIRLTVIGLASRPRFEGELELNRPGWGNLVFEHGMLIFTSSQEGLVRTELQLTSPNRFIKASGTIDQGQCDLVFTGEGIELGLFQINYRAQPLRGKILMVGRISGSFVEPVINAALTSSDLAWGKLQKMNLTAELQGDRHRIQINSAEFSSGEGTLRAQGQIALTQPAQLDLDLFLSNLKLPDLLELLGRSTLNATGQISGEVKLTGTTTNPIWGARGRLDQGLFNAIPVSGEFDLGYQRNQLILERVYLKQREGSLLANGFWKKNELAQLKLQFVDFPIQTLQPWWPAGKDWSGLINATVSGSWAPQQVEGQIVANLKQLSYKKQALGDLRLKGDFSDRGLTIEEAWLDCQNGHLSAKGYLPWPKGLGSDSGSRPVIGSQGNQRLDLRLSLKNVPAELANLFSQNYLITKGKLDGRLYLKKSWEEMEWYGKLEGDDLKLSLPSLPLAIEELELALTIEANRVTLRRAVGNYGSGKFDLNGSVIFDGFKPAAFGLNLTGKKIYYRNHYFDGYSDLDLKLVGGYNNALLSGEIILHHCKLGILGPRPPRRNYQFRPRLEIKARTAQDVHYRQPGFADVTVKGSLQVTGALGAMILNGEVVAKRGILTLYGQTFKVDQGKAIFKNSRGFKPYLDLEARFTHTQADVFLVIRGQVGTDLSLNLSSQPYLPQQNLLSLINWEEQQDGRPLPPNNNLPIGNANLNLVADSLLSEFFYNLRSAIQVDYLYLEHDYYQDELRINIGQYLNDKLFLAYSRSVSNATVPKQQWSFDYSLTPKLKAGGTFSETDGTFWRLLYRIHF